METKYDSIINILLDNWFIAIVVIIAIVIKALPQIKDGLEIFFPSSENRDNYIIEYADETIICEVISRSYDFDVVKIHATTHRLGLRAEREWINKFYPNYTNNMQILKKMQTEKGEIIFDVIPITNGTIEKDIYFDITDFYYGAHVPLTGNVDKYAQQKIKEIYNHNK